MIADAARTRQSELTELTRHLQAGKERERSETTTVHTEPLRIDRVELWHKVSRSLPAEEKKFDYPVVAFKTEEDAKNHWTVIDVQSNREPLTQLALHSPERNYSRGATVQVEVKRGIESQWRDIGGATVQSLRFENLNREQTGIGFPEQRQTHYRILVRNQDNPPLSIDGVAAQGNGYRLLFLAAPGKSYRLHYGAEKAEQPRYDTAPITEPLRAGYQPVAARLGPEQAANPQPPAMDFAGLLNSRYFLGAVIALTVAILAWALVGAGRRIGQMPED
ncbi:DUF3999 family protein [Methylogaea oryzae]|uniref:DUF3999 family protein n=1 Tax=Methylogaea oryzae TaxID=1295382 RepID=UPI0006CF285E|nr:DUF3999 family protein [Methylogaea oryzae]